MTTLKDDLCVKLKLNCRHPSGCGTIEKEVDIFLGQLLIFRSTEGGHYSYYFVFVYNIWELKTKTGTNVHCCYMVQQVVMSSDGVPHTISNYLDYGRVDRQLKFCLTHILRGYNPLRPCAYDLLDEEKCRDLRFVVLTGETLKSTFTKALEEKIEKAKREVASVERRLKRLQRSAKVLEEL